MPERVLLAVNERSAEGPAARGDRELLLVLIRTVHEIRRKVIASHRHYARLAFPEELWGDWKLPGGTLFRVALQHLRTDERELVQAFYRLLQQHLPFDAQGHVIDDGEPVRSDPLMILGRPARGLRVARDTDGAALSFDVDGARLARLPDEDGGVPNAWAASREGHRHVLKKIGAKVVTLPEYENPGTHDPTSKSFDRAKSQIPEQHGRLLAAALPADGQSTCTTWWAYCEHRFFHRFMGTFIDGRPHVHWNGTTNPNAKQNRDPSYAPTTENDIPAGVRTKLLALVPVEGCGCREIRR